jgi:hypothetical protein
MQILSGSRIFGLQLNQTFVRRVILCTMMLAAVVATQSWSLADDDEVTLDRIVEATTIPVAKKSERSPEPLYIMNSDGTNLRKLVQLSDHECSGSPVWTRDGKSILFDAWHRKGTYTDSHIYKVNVDGSWPTDLGPVRCRTRVREIRTRFSIIITVRRRESGSV